MTRSLEAWSGVAGWGTVALVALVGLSGAAATPDGLAVGVPTLPVAAVVAVAVAGFAVLCGRSSAAGLAGLAVVLPGLLLGGLLPGVRAVSGPPLLALAFAGLVIALRRGEAASMARRAFLPVVAGLYLCVAVRVQAQVGPEGDEPHYLMVADSLLRDGDLALDADYREGRYREFHPGDLAPHYRVRGRDGQIYSLHAVGLSLLVLPAYAAGGYAGASLFMALLAALLARELREVGRAAGLSEGASEAAGWILALSPPLVHYAGLVFTEVPAALLLAWALRRSLAPGPWRPGEAVAVGCALGFLPWLNVRYAPLALLFLVHAAWRRRGGLSRLIAPAAASALALAAYHQTLYGFLDPRRVYGRRPELSLAQVPEGVQGLLLDQEFGILAYAPVHLLGLAGWLGLRRGRPKTLVLAVASMLVVVGVASSWPMWRGGWNPPARFLVPLLPLLGLGLARRLEGGLGAGAALLVGWGLWTGLWGAAEPRLVHRDRDQTAPFFRHQAGAEEWTRLLPGYVLAEPDRHRLAAVWVVALALAAGRGRSPDARRLALAAGALVSAAGVASALSDARTGGRDAVRLLGRRAIELPALRVAPVGASWGPEQLDWGPAYDPYRHPGGAVLGSRLPLPPGRYVMKIAWEGFGGEPVPPEVVLRPEGPGAEERPCRVTGGPSGATAVCEVRAPERAVTLFARSGGPFRLGRVTLNPERLGEVE